jgi:hypothetical protein
VIPLQTVAGSLIPDPKLTPGVEPSAELSDWSPSAARTREVAEV